MKRRLLYEWIPTLALLLAAPGAFAQEVVAIVSAKSAVTGLDRAAISDIFLGRSSRFPDGSIAVPLDQDEDSPVRERFYAVYADKSSAQMKAHWSKIIFTGRGQPPRQLADSAEVRKVVAQNPNAIGYIDRRYLDASVRAVGVR